MKKTEDNMQLERESNLYGAGRPHERSVNNYFAEGKGPNLLDALLNLFKRKKITATSPQIGLSDEEIENLPKWKEYDKPSIEMPFSEIVGDQEWERLQRQKANFEKLAKKDERGWISPLEQLYLGYGIHRDRYYKDNPVRIGSGKPSDFQDSEGRINPYAYTMVHEGYKKKPNQLGGLITGGLYNDIPWFIGMKDNSLADQKMLLRHEAYHNQQYPSSPLSLTPIGNSTSAHIITNRLKMIDELVNKNNTWDNSKGFTEYVTDPAEFQVRVQGLNQLFNEQNIPVTKRNIKRLNKQLENPEFRKRFKDKQKDVLQMLDMLKDSPTANEVFWQLQPVSTNNQKKSEPDIINNYSIT